MSDVKTVGVVGCGLMGSGIAEVAARAGFRTLVREVDEDRLEAGLARIDRSLGQAVSRGKLDEAAAAAARATLTGTTALEALGECDLVVEAIVEDLDAKQALVTELDQRLGSAATIASNTSSLCITAIAAATRRPAQVVGLHFFSPVPVMPVVEVVRGLATSDATYEAALAFARAVGKEAVSVPDRPGFIVNRLLIPYLLDAIRAYENGLGTLEDIDKGMTLGCGHPMGPFALLDFIGLDTVHAIANVMHDEFRTPAYASPPLLRRMVLAGRLGRKSGHGFYDYA